MRSPESPRPLDETTRPSAQAALLEDPVPPVNWRQWFPEIVGRSGTMSKVLETVGKIARSDGSVLILGESGTGKELIAMAIHRLSHRSNNQFVALNCSAIPEQLLESELFGHEKGAFTGADKRKIGKFQHAHGGTIFLDEIGDMRPALQAKLLRILQDKKYAMVGSNEMLDTDVRIIAATNADLEKSLKEKAFREDLYYRLNVLPVQLPPLRDRAEDIPDLLEHYIEVQNRLHGLKAPCFLSVAAVRALCLYRWPGNIRQLINVVSRLVVLKGGGEINTADLPPELLAAVEHPQQVAPARPGMRADAAMTLPRPGMPSSIIVPEGFARLPEEGMNLSRFIEDLENSLIHQALERTGNNRNQAAKLLGLNRTTLVERIKKRQLTPLNEPSKEL